MSNDQRPARVRVFNSGSGSRARDTAAPDRRAQPATAGAGAPGGKAAAAYPAASERLRTRPRLGMIALFTLSSLAGAGIVTCWLLFPQVLP